MAVQRIAPGAERNSKEQLKSLRKVSELLKETSDQGISLVLLDLETLKLVVVTDASFYNTNNFRIQMGFVVMMADADSRDNIIHYASKKCHRVSRSVMAAKVHGLVVGFEFAFVIRDMIEGILAQDVRVEAYVQRQTLFNVVAKDGAKA